MLRRVLIILAALIVAVSISATAGSTKARASGSTCTVNNGAISLIFSGGANGGAIARPFLKCNDGVAWKVRVEFQSSPTNNTFTTEKTNTMPGSSCGTGSTYANNVEHDLGLTWNAPPPNASCSGLTKPTGDYAPADASAWGIVDTGGSGYWFRIRYTFLDTNGNTLRQVSSQSIQCCDN